jgi:hypothetical protein
VVSPLCCVFVCVLVNVEVCSVFRVSVVVRMDDGGVEGWAGCVCVCVCV